MTFAAGGADWFVLDTSLRALAAAAGVAVVLRLLRMRAAVVVHAAWTAVLFAMLLMPVLPSIVPALPIPLPALGAGFLGAASSTGQPTSGVGHSAPTPEPTTAVRSTGGSSPARPADRLATSVVPERASRSWLRLVLLAAYTAGVLLFVVRLLYGWSLVSAMIRRAKRGGAVCVDLDCGRGPTPARSRGAPHPREERASGAAQVYQSSEVTVPMTVGAIRPVIVLPVTWTSWDSDTLTAIIAHEAAHVRRRDAAINLAAHLNRAIFWFHPLSWWLVRRLAVTAEHVCDEAAARAIAAPGRYAEILVEMADAVRRNRGRLAWHAVGVNGGGLLDRRIERLLRGDGSAGESRGKIVAAGIGCVLALGTVVACHQRIAATPLREDPELAKRLAKQAEQTRRFEAARDMTQEQADALEQRIAVNPEDFAAREQLVIYYRASSKVAWDKKVPGLRRHALWLIEHHPEHEIQAPALSPQFDPEGFAAAKTLWETHLARPGVSPFLVHRAANFFAPHDKPYAEQLIRRGMAMDADSAALRARMAPDVGGYEWPMQLPSLYGAALLGAESAFGTSNDLRTHLNLASSPYAMDVRRRLETTTDALLLARVGSILARPRSPAREPAVQQALEQARALGVRYLERALALDPNLVFAKATLVRLRLPQHATDADRLANRAFEGYMLAEDITEYAKKDMAAGKQQRDEAKARAEAALKIAAAHPGDPAYSAAVMTAHHVLATAALRDGDRERAVLHMRESVNVPTSEQIQYAAPFSWGRPVNRLLRSGERERVVEFLEALARLTITERERLLRDAQAIREGRMSSSYQYVVAREGQ
jgi:hypothetical protein